MAIAGALESHPVRGEAVDEFLALYARVTELSPEAFTRVWTDPSAYWWLHRAYELVQAVLGAATSKSIDAYCEALGESRIERALARHLDDFKRFVVSLFHLARVDGRLGSALTVSLPFALPGTDLWLDGTATIGIVGIDREHLCLERAGRELRVPLAPDASPIPELTVRRSPLVRHGGCEIVLQPHALSLPGVDIAAPAVAAGLAYQARHAPLLTEALRALERFAPETFRALRAVMRIVALKPMGAGGFTNSSHSDLPGASVLSVVEHPFELADALIHEFHHHALFAIEERGAFFADTQDGITDERYYSPWRPDPRPLRGILLGVHVHVPVCAYWLRVHEEADVDELTKGYALDRVLRLSAQLAVGFAGLDRHAVFSSFGREVWKALHGDWAALRERIAAAALPEDAPALVCRANGAIEAERSRTGRALGVREVVEAHRRAYDPSASPPPSP